ncbi:MAG: hypothetical protein GY832_10090 [Chloroflexi bacterium]|nr:hypothetical protein [Chloroflexota bacterium]
MTDDQTTTLYDVFKYTWEVGRQTRLMIREAAIALHKETQCHFKHMRAWDRTMKPSEHFLQTQFGISRAWVTFVPQGALSLASLFYVQFYYGKHPVVPALMYGSLDPGAGKAFDKVDQLASFYTILDVEREEDGVSVKLDAPFSIVTSMKNDRYKEARLVRVPLESITSKEDLYRIIVNPLAALVRDEVEQARELLQEVETIQWPIRFTGAGEQKKEVEEA